MRMPIALVAAVLAAGLTLPTVAQDAGDAADRRERVREARASRAADRTPMSMERLEAVWTWEARTVTAALGLEEADGNVVRSSWVEVRRELHESMRALAEERRGERAERGPRRGAGEARGPGAGRGRGAGAGPGRGAGMGEARADGPAAEAREAAMADLKRRLGVVVEGERLEAAMTAFGVPILAWDRGTDAVLQLELDDTTRLDVLGALHGFLAEGERIRTTAREGDREGARTAMRAARADFESRLAELLTEEQATAVLQGMRPERRGMRGDRGLRRDSGARPGRRGPGAGPGRHDI